MSCNCPKNKHILLKRRDEWEKRNNVYLDKRLENEIRHRGRGRTTAKLLEVLLTSYEEKKYYSSFHEYRTKSICAT